ncbi:MAG TPA: hypothetical protein VLH56_19025 [Dissulfurispiraceae bacterium]|nr:hypothetical protein [Dissulfurispiraceae bacterium]
MDMNHLMAVRKQIQDGQSVPIETLQACVAFLRENRISAIKKKEKPAKAATTDKKSGEQILADLMNL